jgi:hypothetical protein
MRCILDDLIARCNKTIVYERFSVHNMGLVTVNAMVSFFPPFNMFTACFEEHVF